MDARKLYHIRRRVTALEHRVERLYADLINVLGEVYPNEPDIARINLVYGLLRGVNIELADADARLERIRSARRTK